MLIRGFENTFLWGKVEKVGQGGWCLGILWATAPPALFEVPKKGNLCARARSLRRVFL